MTLSRTLALSTILTVSVTGLAHEPIEIGSRLEPLIDDYLIEQLDGAELTLHKPTPREVAVVFDKPWEGNTSAYPTVFQDGEKFRMYFRGSHYDEKTRKNTHPEFVCYAESRDGIHWTKPELGQVEFRGSKKNNIVWSGIGSHDFAPMKDTNPDCPPDEQYKAMGRGEGGLYAFTSADGIRWSLVSEKPVITKGAFDSQNLAFWDPLRECYVDFHRGFRDGFRDIMTCTSTDFRNWTEPVWLVYPGAPREHLYTNQIAPYYRAPHVYFGFPKRFVPSRRTGLDPSPGVSDGVFMTSRDGRTFHRWGEALVRPGLQPERWVNRNNMTAWGILVTKSAIAGTPDELSIYSSEGYYRGESCRLRRYTLRIDGFVSVQAGLRGGEMLTKPLVFQGEQLTINFSTSAAGSIRVEIQDAAGKPVPGFSLADCPEVFGDELHRVVRWQGGSDVGTLAGRPVRLRFVLADADLFALQFD
jgi:hypothetical protein